jgi:hypothetical protein
MNDYSIRVPLFVMEFNQLMSTRHPQLCNRQNGNRFWVELTHCGGFSTSLQKKADSHGKSSFVQNFDAYLESKSK